MAKCVALGVRRRERAASLLLGVLPGKVRVSHREIILAEPLLHDVRVQVGGSHPERKLGRARFGGVDGQVEVLVCNRSSTVSRVLVEQAFALDPRSATLTAGTEHEPAPGTHTLRAIAYLKDERRAKATGVSSGGGGSLDHPGARVVDLRGPRSPGAHINNRSQ